MLIRKLQHSDRPEWVRMRHALWPETPEAVHALEVEQQQDLDRAAVFVADRGNGKLGAFIEVLIRDWAEGCYSGRVAYIEGWYIDEDLRRTGIGRELMRRAEEWARAKGCTELASDTWLNNEPSHQAHLTLGFSEFVRLIHYRKDL